jgi:hypothetical protein
VKSLGREVVGEEEECVYLLGFLIACEEFFMEVDVTFSVYAGLIVVRFEFESAVDVIVIKGFVEVPAVAEDAKGGVPAVYVPLLGVIGVREQVHWGTVDAVLPGALGARVCTYKVARLGKQIVVFGAACIDGFLRGDTNEAYASVYSRRIMGGGAYANTFSLAEGK